MYSLAWQSSFLDSSGYTGWRHQSLSLSWILNWHWKVQSSLVLEDFI